MRWWLGIAEEVAMFWLIAGVVLVAIILWMLRYDRRRKARMLDARDGGPGGQSSTPNYGFLDGGGS